MDDDDNDADDLDIIYVIHVTWAAGVGAASQWWFNDDDGWCDNGADDRDIIYDTCNRHEQQELVR